RRSRARCLPTAVLPEPIGPMRNTLVLRDDMRNEHSGNDNAGRRRPFQVPGGTQLHHWIAYDRSVSRPAGVLTVTVSVPEPGFVGALLTLKGYAAGLVVAGPV